ncbi:MAG: cytochrome c3 family protein [Bryobacteraceae bacterium]|nr:cytochrome c3 family protein [Bryobacteraceae bacterium]
MDRGVLVFGAGFALAVAAGWLILPGVFYAKVEQPLAFSHEAHTQTGGMACEDCHGFRDDGSFAGIPTLEQCASCHAEAVGTTESERKFVEEYVKLGREPQWLVYSRQPDNAWFPHAPHVKAAGLPCESCHGDHGQSNSLRPLEVNRISGYSRDVMGRPSGPLGLRRAGGMRMDDCVRCHAGADLRHSCLDCHK